MMELNATAMHVNLKNTTSIKINEKRKRNPRISIIKIAIVNIFEID